MKENRIPERILYMHFETTRLRNRSRKKLQVEVREDGRIVDGEGWQKKYITERNGKKLLRTAKNRRILHMPME
jgi:hypothetical protein